MENIKKTKVLLIDDEKSITETITAYAERDGIEVFSAHNGDIGMELFIRQKFDLIIVDWMLPGISGPEIIKFVRTKSQIPILMISARDDESDIVIGLDMGADDYITKPFGPRELIARIKSLLRRISTANEKLDDIIIKDIVFSIQKSEVLKNGKVINFTPNEIRILKVLFENRGIVVSRSKIMEEALGYYDFINDRTLDTHIKNIRKKIEDDPKNPEIIKTIREIGFKAIDK